MEPCRGSDPGPNPGPGASFFWVINFVKYFKIFYISALRACFQNLMFFNRAFLFEVGLYFTALYQKSLTEL